MLAPLGTRQTAGISPVTTFLTFQQLGSEEGVLISVHLSSGASAQTRRRFYSRFNGETRAKEKCVTKMQVERMRRTRVLMSGSISRPATLLRGGVETRRCRVYDPRREKLFPFQVRK